MDQASEVTVPLSDVSLKSRASRARAWLFDAALPFWWEHGFDRTHGGFHDLVGVDGTPVPCTKRTFVQARQVYAFLEGGRLGWPGPWREAVEAGLDTIERRCRSGAGGYVHRLDAAGNPDEMRRDLYDQAFIAFVLARAGDVLARPDLVEQGRAVFAMLDRDWARHPAGYWEGELLPQPPRRQNPHMHLAEAALALAANRYAGPDDIERMNRVAGLLDRYLVDHERGVLPELFEADWTPMGGAQAVTEPGHQFEWYWILERVKAAGGADWTALGRRLWRNGLDRGIDASRNVAIDAVLANGSVQSAIARFWPQTERLKAALAEFGLTGGSSEAVHEASAAFDGLQPYLDTPAAGAFYDKQNPDGSFVQEPARASSLYHITNAYVELLRAGA